MPEVILAILYRPKMPSGVLRAAERLATLTGGARINVLAAGPEPAGLKAAYDDWLAKPRAAPVSSNWHSVTGDPCAAIEERGRRADLIVVARTLEGDDRTARLPFRTALLKTGRPVLVVPPDELAVPDFGRRVAVAWREDEHTAKVVVPALRYVASAERVFLLAGMREGRPAPAVPQVLAEHDVEAELHLMPIGPAGFGEALLAKVHDIGADLLIMGAYAHSPLHDLVYGGVTKFMLGHADVPVLMRY